MKVVVEVSQTISRTYFVEVPDGTPESGIYDAVAAARESWVFEPDWESPMDDPSTDAIYPLDEDGDPDVENPIWPKD